MNNKERLEAAEIINKYGNGFSASNDLETRTLLVSHSDGWKKHYNSFYIKDNMIEEIYEDWNTANMPECTCEDDGCCSRYGHDMKCPLADINCPHLKDCICGLQFCKVKND